MGEGILYAIGTGPGSPDLLTLRAARLLREVNVILAPRSPKNEISICLEIVRGILSESAAVLHLDFPMTKDKEVLEKAWAKAAGQACSALDHGAKTAFLTLGDPMFYSTFIRLMAEILRIRPETRVEIIPGVSSWQAAAAKTRIPLGIGNEIFKVIPGTLPQDELEKAADFPGPLAVIKAGRNFKRIYESLKKAGRAEGAVLASFVESGGENISGLAEAAAKAAPPYMSLIICPAKNEG